MTSPVVIVHVNDFVLFSLSVVVVDTLMMLKVCRGTFSCMAAVFESSHLTQSLCKRARQIINSVKNVTVFMGRLDFAHRQAAMVPGTILYRLTK